MSSSSFTQKTCSVTFVINNFSQLTLGEQHACLRLKKYSPIILAIWPKATGFYGDCVSICLVNKLDTFKFKCTVSILNPEGKKLFTKEFCGTFEAGIVENHFSLIPRQTLLSPFSGYLFDDKLTLFCEIEAIEENPTIRKDFVNLSNNYESILTDEKFSDFTLVVGKDGTEFNVHKNILAARSPVFAAMFEHDCEEKRQNKVTITDMDEDVCGEMLSFVYSGKVKQLDRFAMELLAAADKYQLDSLKNCCAQYLSSNMFIESVANVLALADMHQLIELKTQCLDYICANPNKVKTTDGWKMLNSQLLRELFEQLANM